MLKVLSSKSSMLCSSMVISFQKTADGKHPLDGCQDDVQILTVGLFVPGDELLEFAETFSLKTDGKKTGFLSLGN